MPSYEFETKHELGFLGELDCKVGYYYSPAERQTQTYPGADEGIELEFVDVLIPAVGPDARVSIDVKKIDDTDLLDECLSHFESINEDYR